jgi:hypothetical protein
MLTSWPWAASASAFVVRGWLYHGLFSIAFSFLLFVCFIVIVSKKGDTCVPAEKNVPSNLITL